MMGGKLSLWLAGAGSDIFCAALRRFALRRGSRVVKLPPLWLFVSPVVLSPFSVRTLSLVGVSW